MRRIPLDRKVEYAIRAVGYAVGIGVLAVYNLASNELLSGAISGVLLADFVASIVRGVMSLPGYIADFALDAIASLVLAVVFFGWIGVRIPENGGGMAVGCLVFMSALVIKLSLVMLEDREKR